MLGGNDCANTITVGSKAASPKRRGVAPTEAAGRPGVLLHRPRAQADQLGSWWEDRRQFVQPSEFVVAPSGKVVAATYSSGPLGRIEATDVVRLVDFLEAQARK